MILVLSQNGEALRSMTNKADSRGRKTVLIVEDQVLMRQTLHDFLQDAFPDCNFLDAAAIGTPPVTDRGTS